MSTDYKVDLLSKDLIANYAALWREKALRLERGEYLVAAKFILEQLIGKFPKADKLLKLNVYEKSYSENRAAYVSFNNFTLNVQKDIWENALLGESGENYILAHELGHIILHKYYAPEYSIDPDVQRKSAIKEESAEWQANMFASFFLLPEQKIKLGISSKATEIMFGIPAGMVVERVVENIEKRKRSGTFVYSGDQCPTCHFYEVVQEEVDMICIKCQPPITICSE